MEGDIQFKVPQNIDLEDKIIGPLTLLQFIYLMAGGMVFYVTIKTGNKFLIVLVGLPAALLALALAFIKIQDQPFLHFLAAFALYLVKPKKRIWKRDAELEKIPAFSKQKVVTGQPKIVKRTLEKSELESLSEVLDTSGKIGGENVNLEHKHETTLSDLNQDTNSNKEGHGKKTNT